MVNFSINEVWVKSISKDEFMSTIKAHPQNPYSDTDLEGIYNSIVPTASQPKAANKTKAVPEPDPLPLP